MFVQLSIGSADGSVVVAEPCENDPLAVSMDVAAVGFPVAPSTTITMEINSQHLPALLAVFIGVVPTVLLKLLSGCAIICQNHDSEPRLAVL
jgi:hypothetical protein